MKVLVYVSLRFCVYARACTVCVCVFACTCMWPLFVFSLSGRMNSHINTERKRCLCINTSVKVKTSPTPKPQLVLVLNSGVPWVRGQCASDPPPPCFPSVECQKTEQRENLSRRQNHWDALTLFTIFHTAQWLTGTNGDICNRILFCCSSFADTFYIQLMHSLILLYGV